MVSLDIYGFLTYSLRFYLDAVSAFGAQSKEEINAELILLVFLLHAIKGLFG